MNVLLIGYLGYKNIGDDLMLEGLINHLLKIKKINKITVLCKKNYYNSNKVKFISLEKLSKIKKIYAIISNDIIIWTGGTCIYENPGLYGLLKFVSLCKLFKKKFYFFGIGIGELNSNKGKSIASDILTKSDFIFFRDLNSPKIAKNDLNLKNDYCIGGDLIFLNNIKCIDKKTENNNFIISFSGLYYLDNNYAEFYAKQLDKLVEKYNAKIYFIPAHMLERDDNIFHQKIIGKMKTDKFKILTWNNCNEFMNLYKNVNLHIGMRLHSIIIADLLGIPNVGINYSPKVKYYIDKAKILSKDRLFQLYEALDTSQIDRVLNNYNTPLPLFDNEYKNAVHCINKALEL